jgi:Fe-S-cluster-containing dehydrogenase component
MKPRYAMTVDTRRCVGCDACVLACKQENGIPGGSYRDWVVTETRGVFPDLTQEIRSERCNHCSEPPCVPVCPTGASHRAAGGTVTVEHGKCTGCKVCIASCPYDARFVHPQGYVDKCTFCLHRVLKGKQPACVENCPTQALIFGDRNEPASDVSKLLRLRKYKVNKPESGAKPNVFFLL